MPDRVPSEGPKAMIILKPDVTRTVYLHIGTMGVHRAPVFCSIGRAKSLPLGAEFRRKTFNLHTCPSHLSSRTTRER